MLLIHLHILSVNVDARKRIVKAGQNKCLINHESELTYLREVELFIVYDKGVRNETSNPLIKRVTGQVPYCRQPLLPL